MADRCEHGARLGTCNEVHPTTNEVVDILDDILVMVETGQYDNACDEIENLRDALIRNARRD